MTCLTAVCDACFVHHNEIWQESEALVGYNIDVFNVSVGIIMQSPPALPTRPPAPPAPRGKTLLQSQRAANLNFRNRCASASVAETSSAPASNPNTPFRDQLVMGFVVYGGKLIMRLQNST